MSMSKRQCVKARDCQRWRSRASGRSLPLECLLQLDVMSRYMLLYGVRRKPGTLLDIEAAICCCARKMRRRGAAEFHGFEIAKQLADEESRRLLTAYGTLYRALARLESMGLVTSRREDPSIAAAQNRPIRRLYTLTAAGETAAEEAPAISLKGRPRRQRRQVAPV